MPPGPTIGRRWHSGSSSNVDDIGAWPRAAANGGGPSRSPSARLAATVAESGSFAKLEMEEARRESMAPLAVNRGGVVKSLLSSLAILVLGAAAMWAQLGVTTILAGGLILLLAWSTKFRMFVNGVAVEFTPAG